MNTILLLLFMITIFPQQKGDCLYIGRFLYTLNISRTFDNLTVSTPDGFYVYDVLDHHLKISYPVKEGVKYAVFINNKVYFITLDNRFAIYDDFLKKIEYFGSLRNPKAIGTNGDVVIIIDGNEKKFYSSEGIELFGFTDTFGMFWCGENINLDRDNKNLIFLTPYRKYNQHVGWSEYTVFYPWMNLLYVGSWGDGISIYDMESKIEIDSLKIGFYENSYREIVPQNQNIWVIAENSLTLLKHDSFKTFVAHKTPFLNTAGFIGGASEADKAYFLSEDGKIAIYKNGEWATLRTGIVHPEAIFAKKGLLYISNANQIKIFGERGNVKEFNISGINEISSLGDFIVLKGEENFLFLKNDSVFLFQDSLGYLSLFPLRISKYNPSRTIISTLQGIIVIEKDFNYTYLIPPFNPMYCLISGGEEKFAFAVNNTVWIYHIRNSTWERFNIPTTSQVLSIYLKDDKILFILTSQGLFTLRIDD
ncbi:MAG: hypothetical protein J7J61_09340 [Candidatus Hydrothermae bacterium]|nr:hypothetical protein [Candidatus Hydrothermae bacterium]